MKRAQSAGHTLPLVTRAFSHKSHAVHFSSRKQKTRCIFILFFVYSINVAFWFFSFFVHSHFNKTHCFDNISLHLQIFHLKPPLSSLILKSLFVQQIFSKKVSSPLLVAIYFSKEEISLGAFSDIRFPSLV